MRDIALRRLSFHANYHASLFLFPCKQALPGVFTQNGCAKKNKQSIFYGEISAVYTGQTEWEHVMKQVQIFKFGDPVAYISSCQKAKQYPWTESYRTIARKFELGGAYFWLVIHGKKPFPRKIIDGLTPLLKLNKKEAVYFKLIAYLSSLDIDEPLKREVLNKFRPARYKNSGKKRPKRRRYTG
jgi:hypothetical protein